MEKQYVAMVHETCPICGTDQNESILIHKRFGDLSDIHQKSTGYSKPCETCQSGLDMGAVMIIVADEARSDPKTGLAGLYRTGMVFGITESSFKQIVTDPVEQARVLECRVCVIDYKDAMTIGFESNGYNPSTGKIDIPRVPEVEN